MKGNVDLTFKEEIERSKSELNDHLNTVESNLKKNKKPLKDKWEISELIFEENKFRIQLLLKELKEIGVEDKLIINNLPTRIIEPFENIDQIYNHIDEVITSIFIKENKSSLKEFCGEFYLKLLKDSGLVNLSQLKKNISIDELKVFFPFLADQQFKHIESYIEKYKINYDNELLETIIESLKVEVQRYFDLVGDQKEEYIKFNNNFVNIFIDSLFKIKKIEFNHFNFANSLMNGERKAALKMINPTNLNMGLNIGFSAIKNKLLPIISNKATRESIYLLFTEEKFINLLIQVTPKLEEVIINNKEVLSAVLASLITKNIVIEPSEKKLYATYSAQRERIYNDIKEIIDNKINNIIEGFFGALKKCKGVEKEILAKNIALGVNNLITKFSADKIFNENFNAVFQILTKTSLLKHNIFHSDFALLLNKLAVYIKVLNQKDYTILNNQVENFGNLFFVTAQGIQLGRNCLEIFKEEEIVAKFLPIIPIFKQLTGKLTAKEEKLKLANKFARLIAVEDQIIKKLITPENKWLISGILNEIEGAVKFLKAYKFSSKTKLILKGLEGSKLNRLNIDNIFNIFDLVVNKSEDEIKRFLYKIIIKNAEKENKLDKKNAEKAFIAKLLDEISLNLDKVLDSNNAYVFKNLVSFCRQHNIAGYISHKIIKFLPVSNIFKAELSLKTLINDNLFEALEQFFNKLSDQNLNIKFNYSIRMVLKPLAYLIQMPYIEKSGLQLEEFYEKNKFVNNKIKETIPQLCNAFANLEVDTLNIILSENILSSTIEFLFEYIVPNYKLTKELGDLKISLLNSLPKLAGNKENLSFLLKELNNIAQGNLSDKPILKIFDKLIECKCFDLIDITMLKGLHIYSLFHSRIDFEIENAVRENTNHPTQHHSLTKNMLHLLLGIANKLGQKNLLSNNHKFIRQIISDFEDLILLSSSSKQNIEASKKINKEKVRFSLIKNIVINLDKILKNTSKSNEFEKEIILEINSFLNQNSQEISVFIEEIIKEKLTLSYGVPYSLKNFLSSQNIISSLSVYSIKLLSSVLNNIYDENKVLNLDDILKFIEKPKTNFKLIQHLIKSNRKAVESLLLSVKNDTTLMSHLKNVLKKNVPYIREEELNALIDKVFNNEKCQNNLFDFIENKFSYSFIGYLKTIVFTCNNIGKIRLIKNIIYAIQTIIYNLYLSYFTRQEVQLATAYNHINKIIQNAEIDNLKDFVDEVDKFIEKNCTSFSDSLYIRNYINYKYICNLDLTKFSLSSFKFNVELVNVTLDLNCIRGAWFNKRVNFTKIKFKDLEANNKENIIKHMERFIGLIQDKHVIVDRSALKTLKEFYCQKLNKDQDLLGVLEKRFDELEHELVKKVIELEISL
ncbi:MAG: hypothetical protein J0H68_05985 [Sphingobacteriia bacterium]|nr:hypothetical protein [Sphingobacteriia bacterium]